MPFRPWIFEYDAEKVAIEKVSPQTYVVLNGAESSTLRCRKKLRTAFCQGKVRKSNQRLGLVPRKK
jgi:hypothetical protein